MPLSSHAKSRPPHIIDATGSQTGLFINNEFVKGKEGKTFEVFNPATGKVIANVDEAGAKDVDAAVDAAQKAYDTAWGFSVPGAQRGKMLIELAEAIEADVDIIAAIESMDNGKAYTFSKGFDVVEGAATLRYVRLRLLRDKLL